MAQSRVPAIFSGRATAFAKNPCPQTFKDLLSVVNGLLDEGSEAGFLAQVCTGLEIAVLGPEASGAALKDWAERKKGQVLDIRTSRSTPLYG